MNAFSLPKAGSWQGERLELRPLQTEDQSALYAVASDPHIWEQHPESNRWQRDVFQRFFDQALQGGLALAVLDLETGALIGSSRYYDNEANEVAIGYTFLARKYWGGSANAELKALMLNHAFEWVEKVWFHIGLHNYRSRRAIEKLGATWIPKVENQRPDTAYYCITKTQYTNLKI